jgi:starch synthase
MMAALGMAIGYLLAFQPAQVGIMSVGGLSQVSYFLPLALLKKGIDIRIFTPKYGIIDEKKYPMANVISGMAVPTGEPEGSDKPRELISNVKMYNEKKKTVPTVYFLENQEYFEQRANVYGYNDDHIRFGLLSRGALEFVRMGYFEPDLIHVNDWHTGYLLDYLHEGRKDIPRLRNIASLLSMHNLYQGTFDFKNASEMDFDDGKSALQPFFTDRFYKQNPLKRAIIYSDLMNTVSETYAQQILTDEYGSGLQNLLKELRGKLFGVLNGIDYNDFNPQSDPLIKASFSSNNLKPRFENKMDLVKQFALEDGEKRPLVVFWGRFDEQKGVGLICETIKFLLEEMNINFLALGPTSNDFYRDFFSKLEKENPGRVGAHLMFDGPMARKFMAGADIALFPSKYEPGGIMALEAMHYGCVPVARSTGGLADSIVDYDPEKKCGYGFPFQKIHKGRIFGGGCSGAGNI